MSRKPKSVPEFLKPRIDEAIADYGQYLQGVFVTEGRTDPAFVYTIGNHKHGLPELLTIGDWPPHAVAGVLNILGKMMRENGKPFEPGLVDFGAKYPAKIIDAVSADVRTHYTIQAGQYWRTESYRVQQVLLSDRDGIYPDDPRCDDDYKVPVLTKPQA